MGSTNMGPTYTSSRLRWPMMRREDGTMVGTSRAPVVAMCGSRWSVGFLGSRGILSRRKSEWSGAGLDVAAPDGLVMVASGGEGDQRTDC
jgi:hypothetical protein